MHVWDSNNQYVKAIAKGLRASDVAIDASDNIWVTDFTGFLLKYDSRGRKLVGFDIKNHVYRPWSAAVDGLNHVHIIGGLFHVEEFDSTGKHVQHYGLVEGARGIAIEGSRVYVIERKMKHVKVFNAL